MLNDHLIITTASGKSLNITLQEDDHRQVSTLLINGVRYHVEKMALQEFRSKYIVDSDNEYEPQTDTDGCCVLIAPFSK